MPTLGAINVAPGVVRGATPLENPGRWWDCNQVRWRDGILEPIGGWQRLTGVPFSSPPRLVHLWRDNNDVPVTAVFLQDKIFTDSGSAFLDYTPDDLVSFSDMTSGGGGYGYSAGPYGMEAYGTARSVEYQGPVLTRAPIWTADTFGEDILAVSSADGRLLRWSPSEAPPKDFAAHASAPIGNRAVVVTPERHVVLIGAGSQPRRVAWSGRENADDWDFANVTNLAGFLDLDATSSLVTARKVFDGTLIWSDSEVYLLRHIGSPYVYSADRIGYTTLYSPWAVTSVAGQAAWLGKTGFFMWDGAIRPVASPVSQYVFETIDPTYGPARAFMGSNGTFPEVWLFYPSIGSTENDRYVIFNYVENTWAIGALPRSTMFPGGPRPYPIMGGNDGHLYEHENGWLDGNNSRVGQIWAETNVVNVASGDRDMVVTRILPANGSGYDSLTIKVFARQANEGPERQFGPYAMGPNGYMPARVRGRDLRVRIESAKDGRWSIGQLRADLTSGGRR